MNWLIIVDSRRLRLYPRNRKLARKNNCNHYKEVGVWEYYNPLTEGLGSLALAGLPRSHRFVNAIVTRKLIEATAGQPLRSVPAI